MRSSFFKCSSARLDRMLKRTARPSWLLDDDVFNSFEDDEPLAPQVTSEMPTPKSLSLHPFWFDLGQGSIHGTMQAFATGLFLTPLDKINAQINVHKNEGSIFAKFVVDPFKGAGYNIKTNIPRNCVVFTSLPLVRDELRQQGFTEVQSKAYSGIFAGLAEAYMTKGNTAKKIIGWTSSTGFHAAWENMTKDQQHQAQRAAFRWGALRGGVFYAIMPGMADMINNQLKILNHPESYALKGLDIVIAGGLASGLTSFISYPFDRIQKVQIANPEQPVLKPMLDCFGKHGFWKCMQTQTHLGAFSAILRMACSGVLWYGTLKASEELIKYVAEKETIQDSQNSNKISRP